MKRYSSVVFAVLLGACVWLAVMPSAKAHTGSPSPTTFVDGNALTAAQLNDTFNHLHNTFSAGIVNAHLSTSAAIAHSKLATPALVPKAWARVASCGVSPCTVDVNSGVTSVTRAGAGAYDVTFTTNPVNTSFSVQAQSHTALIYCVPTTFATASPHIRITCYTATTGAATDASFSVLLMDDV